MTVAELFKSLPCAIGIPTLASFQILSEEVFVYIFENVFVETRHRYSEITRNLQTVDSHSYFFPVLISVLILLVLLFIIDMLESKTLAQEAPAQSLLSNPKYILSAAFDVGGTGFVLFDDDYDDIASDIEDIDRLGAIGDKWSFNDPKSCRQPFIGLKHEVDAIFKSIDSFDSTDGAILAGRAPSLEKVSSDDASEPSTHSKSVGSESNGENSASSKVTRRTFTSSHSSGQSSGASSSVFSTLYTIGENDSVVESSNFSPACSPARRPKQRAKHTQIVQVRSHMSPSGDESDGRLSDILYDLGVEHVSEFGTSDTDRASPTGQGRSLKSVSTSRMHSDKEVFIVPSGEEAGTGIMHVVRETSRRPATVGTFSEELSKDIQTIIEASEVISSARKYHNGNLASCEIISKLNISTIALPRSSLLSANSSNTLRVHPYSHGDIDDDASVEPLTVKSLRRQSSHGSEAKTVTSKFSSRSTELHSSMPSSPSPSYRTVEISVARLAPFLLALSRHHRYIRPFTYASMHRTRTHRLIDMLAHLLSTTVTAAFMMLAIENHYHNIESLCNDSTSREDCNNTHIATSLFLTIRSLQGNVLRICAWHVDSSSCEPNQVIMPTSLNPLHVKAFIYYLVLAAIILLISSAPKAIFNYLLESVTGKLPGIIDSKFWQHLITGVTEFLSSLRCLISCGYFEKSNLQQQRWYEVNKLDNMQADVSAQSAARGTLSAPNQIPKRVSEWSMSVGRRNVTKYAYCDFVSPAEEARVVYTSVREYFASEREKQELPWRKCRRAISTSGASTIAGTNTTTAASLLGEAGSSSRATDTILGVDEEQYVSGIIANSEGLIRIESMMENMYLHWDSTPQELSYYQKIAFWFSHKRFTEWRILISRQLCDEIVHRMMGYAGMAVRDAKAAYESLRNEEEDNSEGTGSRIFEKMYWSQSPFAHGHKFCMQLLLLQSAIIEQLPLLGVGQGSLFGSDFGLQRLAARRSMYQYDGFASGRMSSFWWFALWTIIFVLMIICAYLSMHLFNVTDSASSVTSRSHFWYSDSIVALLATAWALDFVVQCVGVWLIDVHVLNSTKPHMQKVFHVFHNIVKTMHTYSGGKAACLHGYIRLVQHFSPSCRASRSPISNGLPAAEILLAIDDQDIALCRSKDLKRSTSLLIYSLLVPPCAFVEILMHLVSLRAYSENVWLVLSNAAIDVWITTISCLMILASCHLFMAVGSKYTGIVFGMCVVMVILWYIGFYIKHLCRSTPAPVTDNTDPSTNETGRQKNDWKSRRDAFLRSRTKSSSLQRFLISWFYHEDTETIANTSRTVSAFLGRALFPQSNCHACTKHQSYVWRNMNMIPGTMSPSIGIAASPVRVEITEEGESAFPSRSSSALSEISTYNGICGENQEMSRIPEAILTMLIGCEYDHEIAYMRRRAKKTSSLMQQIRQGSSRSILTQSHRKGSDRLVEMTPQETSLHLQTSDNYESPTHAAAHDANSLRMVQLLSKQRIYRATNNLEVSVMRAKRVFKQISTENEGTVAVEMQMSNPNDIHDIAGIAVGPQSSLPPSPRPANAVIYFLLDQGGLRRVLESTLASYHPEGVPLSLSEIMYFFDQLNEYVSKMCMCLAEYEVEDDADSICSDSSFDNNTLPHGSQVETPPITSFRFRHNSDGNGGSSSSSGIGRRFSSQSSTLSSVEEGTGSDSPGVATTAAVANEQEYTQLPRLPLNPVTEEDAQEEKTQESQHKKQPSKSARKRGESPHLLYDRTGQLLCVEMHHFLNWYCQMCKELIQTRHVDEINRLQREDMLSRALPFVFGRKKSRSSAEDAMMHHVKPLDTLQLDSPRKSMSMPPSKREHPLTARTAHSGDQSQSRSSEERSSDRSFFSMSSFFRSPTERRAPELTSSHSHSRGSSSTASDSRVVSVPYSSLSIRRPSDSDMEQDVSIRNRSPKHKDLKPSLSFENVSKSQGRGLVIDRPGMFSHSPDKARRAFFPELEEDSARNHDVLLNLSTPVTRTVVEHNYVEEIELDMAIVPNDFIPQLHGHVSQPDDSMPMPHVDSILVCASVSSSVDSNDAYQSSDHNTSSSSSTIEINSLHKKQSHTKVKAKHPPRPVNKRRNV